MAVVLQQQGTVLGAVTTGNLTVNLPAYIADDIVVITTVGYVPNTTTGTNTQTLASPWTKYTPAVTRITGGIIDTEHAFWWARATSVNSLGASVSITRPTSWDTGTDTVWAGRAYVIRGCRTTGNPFDALVATAPSAAANPTLPAVTVNGNDRLVIAFYVASDNLQAPTAATGYTPQTALTTNTGTDAGFQSYTDLTNTTVSAVTPTGGATTAQNFQVYFSASFAPPDAAILDRTATGSGTGTESATGVYFSILDRTATGSGTGTESATGTFFTPVVVSRTADGSGTGTQTAVGVRVKVRTVKEFGQSTLSAVIRSTSNNSNLYTGGVISYAQSFVGDGKTLDLMGFHATGGAGKTGTVVAKLYLASGGKPTGSVLAISNPLNAVDLPIFSTTANYVRFSFTGANKYLLSNGVEYCAAIEHTAATTFSDGVRVFFATPNDGSFAKIGVGTFSQTSNGSTWTTTANYALLHFVETSSAIGAVVLSRTATGSGIGAETATGAISKDRTATGSGTGTEFADGSRLVVVYDRTATGSGVGTQTATRLVTHLRTADGSGTGTQSATGSITRLRTATGSGTGTESTNSLVVGIRTATGTGSGTSTADSFKTPIRTASANGVGSSTADTFHNKVRSASGSGGASPSAIAIGLHISIRTATGNGSGNSDSTIRLTILRTVSGNGVGSSVSEEVLIHVRSATGSGTGTSTVVVQLIAIRTASGSGLGTQTVVSNKVKLRTARNRAKADTLDYWDDSGLAGANWYYQALNTSSGISRYGQSFQATKTVTLDSAEFLLHKLGAPPGNVRAQLYASTGFSNIGALLATSEPVSASTLLGPFPETSSSAYWDETWKPTKFTFSGNQRVQITSGTNYVIVLDYDGYPTSDNSNTVRITYQYTPDAVAVEHPGIRFRYLPGSSSWTTNSTQDVVFAVVHATTFAAVSTVIAKTARSSGYADATTITDNSGFVTDTDFSDYISSTRFAAQSFLGNGKVIDSLLGHISYETTPPATLNYVYAEIWTHTGTFGVDGLPGTLLATSNAVPNTALGLNVWDETNLVKFTFSGSQKIMLTNATPYYVVWRYTGTDTSDQIGVSYWLQSSYKAIQVSTGNSAYKGSSGLWTAYADLYPLIIFPATALSFVDLLRLATGSGTGTQNSFGKNAEIGINWSYWGSRILI